jgi:hypothetical protein
MLLLIHACRLNLVVPGLHSYLREGAQCICRSGRIEVGRRPRRMGHAATVHVHGFIWMRLKWREVRARSVRVVRFLEWQGCKALCEISCD